MEKESLFVFDFRNAKPSLESYSPKRVIHLRHGKQDIFRVSESRVDPLKRIFITNYECFIIEDGKVKKKFLEEHRLRFFDTEEIREMLGEAGFKEISFFPFMQLERPLLGDEWVICVVAKK
jgi:ubiquinone/menaquinone biosynthesis C-methylase UbiE